MSFPRLLMEDHCYAYGLWKEHGLSNGICVHVDAHLDLMDRGFTPSMLDEISQIKSARELNSCLTPTFLPWGGIHCGNYLYPALVEGVVTHLIWVVPKAMVAGASLLEFARCELPNWMDLSLEENASLRLDGPRVEAVLAGQRFTLCTSENLPDLDERPILLDIDVDYFQDQDDRIWQTPGELYEELNLDRVDALSVAVSVDGGYTCLEHRFLGEVTERVFSEGVDSPWVERTRAILSADSERGSDPNIYKNLAQADDPEWLQAAFKLKTGLAEGLDVLSASLPASELDSRFKATAMNEALCQFRVGRIDEALAQVDGLDELQFVRAVLAFQCGRFELAKTCWDSFLETQELSSAERGFALFIRGQSHLQLGQFEQALTDLEEAIHLDSDNFQYTLFCGLAYQLNNELKKAAKLWRKTLSKHDSRLASIGLHLELSRLYRVMGKQALADAELRRVTQKDSRGEYKMVVQLEHLRSKKLQPTIPEPNLPGMWAF